jgi:hypothetical protein
VIEWPSGAVQEFKNVRAGSYQCTEGQGSGGGVREYLIPVSSAQQRWMTQDEAIAEIARRLVDYFHPERVYLLGSAARGDGGPDSDLDFCVVLPDEAPESLYRPGIHKALWGVGTAADVVRWPPATSICVPDT